MASLLASILGLEISYPKRGESLNFKWIMRLFSFRSTHNSYLRLLKSFLNFDKGNGWNTLAQINFFSFAKFSRCWWVLSCLWRFFTGDIHVLFVHFFFWKKYLFITFLLESNTLIFTVYMLKSNVCFLNLYVINRPWEAFQFCF